MGRFAKLLLQQLALSLPSLRLSRHCHSILLPHLQLLRAELSGLVHQRGKALRGVSSQGEVTSAASWGVEGSWALTVDVSVSVRPRGLLVRPLAGCCCCCWRDAMVAVSTVHSRARGMGATAILSSLSDCPAVLLPCLAEPLSIGDARDAEWIHLAATYASVVLTSVLPQRCRSAGCRLEAPSERRVLARDPRVVWDSSPAYVSVR